MLISLLARDKEQLLVRRYSLTKSHFDDGNTIGHLKQLEFKGQLNPKTLKKGGYTVLAHGVPRFVVVCFYKFLKSILYVS